MTVLSRLADFVHGFDPDALTDADRDHLRLHVLDTVGATLAGTHPRIDDRMVAWTAACRATEMDDIHLASCTTPGSVVVPVALALDELSTPESFLAAMLVGYEVMVRAGLAIEGPKVLGDGIWPTLFAAPLGAAAVTARALELDAGATAGALSTALALSTGTSMRAASRWLTLGIAAKTGVLAARGAAAGLKGSRDLLEARGERIAGVALSGAILLDQIDRRFHFRDVGLKPYPIARQALAAVENCRGLASAPAEIERITIGVPAAQRRVIDHPGNPGNPGSRMESLVNVRYLAALAILAPEKLHDVERSPPFTNEEIQKLASRVTVETASDLERHYPERWPARVEIQWKGRALSREGDVDGSYSWNETLEKFRRALSARMPETRIDALARVLRAIDASPSWPIPELREALEASRQPPPF